MIHRLELRQLVIVQVSVEDRPVLLTSLKIQIRLKNKRNFFFFCNLLQFFFLPKVFNESISMQSLYRKSLIKKIKLENQNVMSNSSMHRDEESMDGYNDVDDELSNNLSLENLNNLINISINDRLVQSHY